MMGPTESANFSFGSHPVGMKRAVMRPQAMIAAMFGITIAARKPPIRCNRSLIVLLLLG